MFKDNRFINTKMTGVQKSRYGVRIILILTICICETLFCAGCGLISKDSDKVSEIEFTVVEEKDIPLELKKLIDSRKENTVRLTYATKDDIYIVAGYGTQKSSGYSIRVNDVYLGTNAVFVDLDLLGPEAGEQVTELPTQPYIVLKIAKRDEAVVFQM